MNESYSFVLNDTAKVGQNFATSMGPGGVIGTKITWLAGPENMVLKDG